MIWKRTYFDFKSIGFVGLLLILCCLLEAQIPNPIFKNLSQEDGLSQGINAYILKDSKGFVWISSLDGINRFDGKEVKTYFANAEDDNGVSSDNLVSGNFFEDEQTNLWYTSHTAIQYYTRSTDSLQTFRLKNRNGEWIRSDYYGFFLDGNNQYWIRINNRDSTHLYQFDIETQQSKLVYSTDGLKGQRYTVVADSTGQVQKIISALIIEGGVFAPGLDILDWQKQSTLAFFKNNDEYELPSLQSNNVYADPEGVLWIASPKGLFQLDPFGKSYKSYSIFKDVPLQNVWAIIPYTSKYLFVSTGNLGILLFDKERATFVQQFYHNPQSPGSIRSNKVNELYLDNHENLWVSIWDKGLDYANLRKNKFTSLLNDVGSEKRVFSIAEMANGDVLCGTVLKEGIYRFNQQKELVAKYKIAYSQSDEINIDLALSRYLFCDLKGRNWLLYHNHVALLNEEKGFFEEVDFTKKELRHMIQLNDERLLISASEGELYILDESEGFQLKPFQGIGKIDTDVFTIYQTKNNDLYIAENGEGLLVYEQQGAQWRLRKKIPGLGNCLSFLEDEKEQTLWIASSIGLIKLNTQTLSVTRLSKNNGQLSTETFYSILQDANGSFWMSSNKGVINYHPEDSSYHRYLKIDGLQGNEFNAKAYYMTSKGEIWFGGFNGLNVFHPQKIKQLPFAPDVQITQLTVNDEDTKKRYVGGLQTNQRLDFSYGENTLSFDFVALEYSDADKNQFQYKMEGLDKVWVNGGNHGFARYGNMPPGSYTFKVKAANSDGVWQDIPDSVELFIAKPFWQKAWFYLLCLLFISTVIYAVFQYRLQQALKIERMRVKISSDLHDDVGGLLSGLAMQSEILELKVPAQHKPKLQHISEMSRSAMSRMRDTVWAIDSRKDKIEDLIDRMRDHATEVLIPKEIQFDFQLDDLDTAKKIPVNYRQNIYLIYKEAITNIAKHSNGDKVLVRLMQKGVGLNMTIQDNGQVTPGSLKSSGLGMSNMRMRAEQINATFEIDDSDGVSINLSITKLKE